MNRLELAITAWRELLGEDHVLTGRTDLDLYRRTTLPDATSPLAVIRPGNTDEVVELVKVAAKFEIPIYPISRGKNWGYGDACAVTQRNVIVDLSRMNRIVEVNPDLAYAVLEPGVTQGQLYDYLREHRIPLWMDCTGAGPEGSIVGNVLERGFGHTPYSDHFRHAAGMEVVLANGQVLQTGLGHYKQAQCRWVYPYGIGPWIDGLFTQSSMGIVTKMGIWLMPEPEAFTAFFFSVADPSQLAALVDALRPLRLSGMLQSAVHIGNDLRVLSGEGKFPSQHADLHAALPESLRQEMLRSIGLGAWNCAGALYGTRAQVREARRKLRTALKAVPVDSLHFLNDSLLGVAQWTLKWLAWAEFGRALREKLEAARPIYDLLKGIPNPRPLLGAYWRNKHPPATECPDPAQDNCGLIWLTAILPMQGSSALDLMDLVVPIYAQYGFDPLVTITLINSRALDAVMTIAYDRESESQRDRASACYESLLRTVMQAGYIPYRVGIQSMQNLELGSEVFWQVAHRLKQSLDPSGILSPGRYDPLHWVGIRNKQSV